MSTSEQSGRIGEAPEPLPDPVDCIALVGGEHEYVLYTAAGGEEIYFSDIDPIEVRDHV